MENKNLVVLVLGFIAFSILLFTGLRKMKTGAFLEARKKSCDKLEKNLNELYQSENYTSKGNISIKSCDCYYAPDVPDKEVEKKSVNYCTCDCVTSEGELIEDINIRKS